MNEEVLKIINARVITPKGVIDNGSILVAGSKIVAIGTTSLETESWTKASRIIDAAGKYLSPGFIDIHVHGGGGHDFMDNTLDAFLQIAVTHARHGTTAMTPTTLSSGKESLLKTLAIYEEADLVNGLGSKFIGMHIEGPYFAMNQRGAQDPKYIRMPDAAEYTEIVNSSSVIKRWSAAPELPGALDLGRFLKSKGIMPAIAHTDAIYEEVLQAIDAGYTHVTHLYSAMSGVTRRDAYRFAGVIESALLLDELTVEIIADGTHLPAALLQLIYKIKGPGKIALITDAMRGAAMPAGDSILGGLDTGIKVIIEDGVAKLPDRSAFAGSVATADKLVRNMMKMGKVSLLDTIAMMTITPANIMGVGNKKGSIETGKDADLVIFDDDINVSHTIIAGKLVYSS